MLDHLGTLAGYLSLHTGSPGTTGTNEVTGGSPAYARKAVTWASASGGSMSLNGTLPTFDIPAGTTIQYVGLWSASTSGTFYGYAAITNETYGSQGTYTLTAGTADLNAA